ncbi:MAG: hypothetical protein ABWY50_03495, partial [Aeromicrobium sp.]
SLILARQITSPLRQLVDATRGVASVEVTSCLLACEKSNVVVVQPDATARLAGGRPVWLRAVLDVEAVDEIASWVRAGGPGAADLPGSLTPLLTTPGALGEQVL